jgi:MSHA biogenesis protein MshJ
MSAAPAALGGKLKLLLARIDALSLRERLMVLGAVLVLIGFIGDTLLLAPQRARLAIAHREAAGVRAEMAKLDGQLLELRGQMTRDPNEVQRMRLTQLTGELSTLNSEFARLERSLIAPAQMAPLLEQVLRRTSGVSVVQLQTLPAQALPERDAAGDKAPEGAARAEPAATTATTATTTTTTTTATATATGATDSGQPALYRHGVEITLRGSYRDLLQYVHNVERLPVRVYFGRAVLDATRYPDVDLKLTVYTLSLDKAWLSL